MKKIITLLILVAVIILGFFLLRGKEKTNGIPVVKQELVESYIRENISSLSPEEEVLGGSFYVTSVDFEDDNSCVVEYEDGHIALKARAEFEVSSDDQVEITSFQIIEPEDSNQEEVNFSEIGNIVKPERTWDFIYEEPGKPALRVNLVFDGNSKCLDESEDQSCSPVYWENGDRAEIIGIKTEEQVLVKSLRIVGENSQEISSEISSFEECVAQGYEVLYPECVGCSPYCETPDGIKFEQEICVDQCGNGVCEDVVCLGSGCPCVETAATCPEDCS